VINSPNVTPVRTIFLTAILMSLHVGAPSTVAQASPQERVTVVGHLPLDGMRVNQMFLQQRDGKYFLYLHRPAKEVFASVDVTNPGKPILLKRSALKDASGTQVQTPASGSALALTVTPEGGAAQATPTSVQLPTETVQFVDMSNPKKAKSLKTFSGVTSVYSEDGRKLVYLVNGEGLWIVSHRMTHPMPLCTSEDALTPFPDCQ
jgi:hypothetical protein